MYASDAADRFTLRLPDGMRHRIKLAAAANLRSMNSEVIFQLERAFPAPEAATGVGVGNQAPAAAQNTAARQGGDIINHGK